MTDTSAQISRKRREKVFWPCSREGCSLDFSRMPLGKISNRVLWMLPSSGTLRGYHSGKLIDFIFAKASNYCDLRPCPEIAAAKKGGGFRRRIRRV